MTTNFFQNLYFTNTITVSYRKRKTPTVIHMISTTAPTIPPTMAA